MYRSSPWVHDLVFTFMCIVVSVINIYKLSFWSYPMDVNRVQLLLSIRNLKVHVPKSGMKLSIGASDLENSQYFY